MQLTGEKRNAGEDRKIAGEDYSLETEKDTVGKCGRNNGTHRGKERERGRPIYSWRREGDSWIQMAKLEPTKKERNNQKEIGC